ncbi:MAG: rRNA maturation RNase YbeY [Chitinophagaceae bacterium]
MSARFFEQDIKSCLTRKRALGKYLEELIRLRKPNLKSIRLQYVFCTDSTLHKINLQFLHHDDYTDIITFDLSDKEHELVSEIHISIERVRENAQTFQSDFNTELHRVIFHGALHLCGLGDKTETEKKIMRNAEDEALKNWFAISSLTHEN